MYGSMFAAFFDFGVHHFSQHFPFDEGMFRLSSRLLMNTVSHGGKRWSVCFTSARTSTIAHTSTIACTSTTGNGNEQNGGSNGKK